MLRGGMAYTRAVFREGPFAGNDVPLVSRYTAMRGVTWNIWQNYLVADATLRAWSERFMDNDQANTQRRIPGERNGRSEAQWRVRPLLLVVSASNNLSRCALLRLRDRKQRLPDGRFSAYPLPGRTYMVKAGATF